MKIPLLERDLKNLNGEDFDPSSLVLCRDLPALDSFAQVIGCLYVLEGATLGGQIIGRHLRQNLNLSPENGAAVFNNYGERVWQMWKAFSAMANEQAEILKAVKEIIASAVNTFTKFDTWLGARTEITKPES